MSATRTIDQDPALQRGALAEHSAPVSATERSSQQVCITLSAIRDLTAVEADWRFLESGSEPSFFQTWTWVGCLAEQRFPRPMLLRAESRDRLVGLALLNHRSGFLLGDRVSLNASGNPSMDSIYVEHNGVLLAPGAEKLMSDCLRAMLRVPEGAVPRTVRPRDCRLELPGVDAVHLQAARQAGITNVIKEHAAPFVDLTTLPAGSDSYLARLSANMRYQLRRSERCFTRLGPLVVQQATTYAQALAFLDALATQHQATWKARGKDGAFANPAFLQFHHALIVRALPRGEVSLLRISAGDFVLGYLYNFSLRGRIFSYQSGFDYAGSDALAGPHAKPGLTCHLLAVRRAQADGAVAYDFLAGSDRYKTSLSNASQPLYWLELSPYRLGQNRAIPGIRKIGSRLLRVLGRLNNRSLRHQKKSAAQQEASR